MTKERSLPLVQLAPEAPLVAPEPGCHDCPRWTRRNAVIGQCGGRLHGGSLSSYAGICIEHPNFARP